jgi:hypothetical protein
MLSPGIFSFFIWQGSTYSTSFQIKASDGSNLSTPGYTARMQARDTYDAPTTRLNLVSGDGYLAINSTGLVTLNLTPSQTANLPVISMVYDLELVDGGNVYRILMGNINVSPEVTR